MPIKIHANRVLATIHVAQIFLGVFKGAQIKSGPKAPTDLNAVLAMARMHIFQASSHDTALLIFFFCCLAGCNESICAPS